MNNLIKVNTNENDIFIYLLKSENFTELFNKVCDLKNNMNKDGLKILLKILSNPIFYILYDTTSITNLRDVVLMEKCLPCSNPIEQGKSEKEIQNDIIKNFEKIFPNFNYEGQEIKVENIGRIDILASEKETHRPVIIEIKKDKGNPNKQLLAYSKAYKNPILIGITEMNSGFLDGICYYSIKELLNYRRNENE